MAQRSKISSKMYGTLFYRKWASMKTRCYNKNEPRYKDWGGRGITVCKEWQDFDGFYSDMYSTYKDGLSLERVDNNKDYCKENCQWINPIRQNSNKRNSRRITIGGETKIFSDWIKLSGIKSSTVRQRFYGLGWSIERSLREEVRHRSS